MKTKKMTKEQLKQKLNRLLDNNKEEKDITIRIKTNKGNRVLLIWEDNNWKTCE